MKELYAENHKTLIKGMDNDSKNGKIFCFWIERVDNLEMVTPSENIRHSFENGLQKAKFGKEHPLYKKYGKKNKTSKKVNQYDLNGNFIKTWDSIMDVERKLKINNGNISSCCNGKKNNAGGFIWKHYEMPKD